MNQFIRPFVHTMVAALMVLGSGCESGDGGGGDSIVQGKLVRFSGGSATVERMAKLAVGGVTVSIEGTDIQATTRPDGTFVLENVPAGARTLIFTSDGAEARLNLDVPENAKIELQGVSISSSGSVSVREIEIEIEDESEDESGDDNGGDRDDDSDDSDDDSDDSDDDSDDSDDSDDDSDSADDDSDDES